MTFELNETQKGEDMQEYDGLNFEIRSIDSVSACVTIMPMEGEEVCDETQMRDVVIPLALFRLLIAKIKPKITTFKVPQGIVEME